MTTIISVVATLVVLMIIGAIIKKVYRNQQDKLLVHAMNHDFVSDDKRIRGHVKDCLIDKLIVDGVSYVSIEEVFSKAKLTKDMHSLLRKMQKEMTKLRMYYTKTMVLPNAYQEFKDTPVGTLRIYKEGPIRLTSRLTVIIGKDNEGRLMVGRTLMSKKDLLTDSYWVDFKMSTANEGVTQEEAEEYRDAFMQHLVANPKYKKELKAYFELLSHLELHNKHKELEFERGQLVFDGRLLAVEVPVTSYTMALPTAESKKYKEDQLLILNARRNKH